MNKSTTWNLFVLYHKKTKENVDGEVTVCVIDIRSILGDPGAVSRFQVRAEEPLGTLSYKTSSKRSQSFWYLIDARNLCVFLPNQSEVCFEVLSCVLTRRCTRSSVSRLFVYAVRRSFTRGEKFQSQHTI